MENNKNDDNLKKISKMLTIALVLLTWVLLIGSAYVETERLAMQDAYAKSVEEQWEALKLSGTGILVGDDYVYQGTERETIEKVVFDATSYSSNQYLIWTTTEHNDIVNHQSVSKRNVILHKTIEEKSYLIHSKAAYISLEGLTERNIVELYLTEHDLKNLVQTPDEILQTGGVNSFGNSNQH